MNLTSTIYIDIPLFVTSIYTRLVSEDPDAFSAFYSALQNSFTTAKFKVLLCKQYLTATNLADTDGAPGLPGYRPKPQARAVRTAAKSDHGQNITPGVVGSTTMDVNAAPASIASKPVMPSPLEILQLLENPDSESRPPAQLLRVKFELLMSYLSVQNSALTPEQKVEWKNAVKSGQVSRVIDSAFSNAESAFYKESLALMIAH